MRNLIFGVVLFSAGFGVYKYATQPKIKRVSFAAIESQVEYANCQQQKSCFVVYVAPWCPACHQFISNYKQHKDIFKAKGLGFVYIVGADENRQKEIDMQISLAPEAVLDSADHAFLKHHRIKSFPTVLLVNKAWKVLKQGQLAYDFINERMNDQK